MKKTYAERKAEVRELAIEWQTDYFPNNSLSWGEVAFWNDYFEKLGRRYGLLTEFKENGIC